MVAVSFKVVESLLQQIDFRLCLQKLKNKRFKKKEDNDPIRRNEILEQGVTLSQQCRQTWHDLENRVTTRHRFRLPLELALDFLGPEFTTDVWTRVFENQKNAGWLIRFVRWQGIQPPVTKSNEQSIGFYLATTDKMDDDLENITPFLDADQLGKHLMCLQEEEGGTLTTKKNDVTIGSFFSQLSTNRSLPFETPVVFEAIVGGGEEERNTVSLICTQDGMSETVGFWPQTEMTGERMQTQYERLFCSSSFSQQICDFKDWISKNSSSVHPINGLEPTNQLMEMIEEISQMIKQFHQNL